MEPLIIVDLQKAFPPPAKFVESVRRYSRRFPRRIFTRFVNPKGSLFRTKLNQRSCLPGTADLDLLIGDIDAERHAAAGRRVFHRVPQQIHEHRRNLVLVDLRLRKLFRQHDLERQVLFVDLRPNLRQHFVEHAAQVGHLLV